MEAVRNYLITKKTSQKDNHDKTHNVKPLSELIQGQEVLFLSPADPNQYIEGTIITKAPQPRSYLLESQGKTYCQTCQHIHPLTNTTISRPSMPKQQNATISRPSMPEHQNATISRPSTSVQQNAIISRPSTSIQQNATISRPSTSEQQNTVISRPSMPKPIPAPCRKFLTRPPQPTPTTPMLDDVIAHLNTVNQSCIIQTIAEQEPVPADQTTESDYSSLTHSPTATRSTESESQETTEDTTSFNDSQSTTSDNSLASTTSDRQLRPRYPISYNETLLARLNRIPHIRTFNNLSIPRSASDSDLEDTPEEEENHEQLDNSANGQ